MLSNGWNKQNLVKLARTYNDQIVKAQLKGAVNPAAVVRRDQAMQLARHFFNPPAHLGKLFNFGNDAVQMSNQDLRIIRNYLKSIK